MLAAICGAVMSSFNAGVNSASTMFTMDLYSEYINKDADSAKRLRCGRIAAVCIVIFACCWTPVICLFSGVFQYIQEIWGFLSPGIVAVFLVGMVSKRMPRGIGKWILVLGVLLYGCFRVPGWLLKEHHHPDMDKWMDEKSMLICDENYAERKIALITSSDYPDRLKKATVFGGIDINALNRLRAEDAPHLAGTQTEEGMNDLVEKAYGTKDEKDMGLTAGEHDALAAALVREFASDGLVAGKELDDYENSDLIKMATVQSRKLNVGFKPESDFRRFQGDEFLRKVTEGDSDAINALAGYPSDFPAWGYFSTLTFLHHMLLVLALLVLIMLIASVVKPLEKPVTMPVTTEIELVSSPSVYIVGVIVLLCTLGVYLLFSGLFF